MDIHISKYEGYRKMDHPQKQENKYFQMRLNCLLRDILHNFPSST